MNILQRKIDHNVGEDRKKGCWEGRARRADREEDGRSGTTQFRHSPSQRKTGRKLPRCVDKVEGMLDVGFFGRRTLMETEMKGVPS